MVIALVKSEARKTVSPSSVVAVLDMNDQANRISYFCAAPLVTDDAEFLILLATGPVFDSALRVYRKGADSSEPMQDGTVKGVRVRDIKLEELWPATKIDSSRLATDYRPEWFAGGSFDFAPGNLKLIHKTRWGTTVRINLPDGKTLKKPDLACLFQIYSYDACGRE